jgi:glycosidase
MKNLNNRLFIVFIIFFWTQCVYSQKLQSKISSPEWAYTAVIYEINIRQFSKEGNFAGVEKDLPRLKDLGVDILWFMPIHPIGEKNRKGQLGSYYAVKDYYDVNPEFGTKEEFKRIIDSAHALGMKVIIDWVANHTAWDNSWTITNPDFYVKDSTGNFALPNKDWTDVIKLDYSNLALRDSMINVMKYWIKEFNIDGFRCDVAAEVPTDFWEKARASLDSIKSVFMLAEAHEPELHIAAFDATYSWNFHFDLHQIAQGKEKATKLKKEWDWEKKTYPENAIRMRFTTNHDENSWNGTEFEKYGAMHKAAAVFCYIINGMPLIYNGQESASNKRLKFFERDPIIWGKYQYAEFYKSLNNLKKSRKSLAAANRGGKTLFIPHSNEDEAVVIARYTDDEKTIGVFNFSNNKITIEINSEFFAGAYKEYFTGRNFIFAKKAFITLQPYEYRVYIK